MSRSAEPRILISRLSAVGDCLQTLPLLCSLRDHFPQASLFWVVERGAAPLIRGHACLDELVVLPKGWLKSPSTLAQLRRRLTALRPEITLDPQSLTRSSVAAWLSGASQRIGFASPQGRELAPWLNRCNQRRQRPHMVDAYLELLEPLGVFPPAVRFDVPQDRQACETLQPLLQQPHLSDGFAVVNPGAGWPSKLWPSARYAEVVRQLGQHCQLPTIVVWSGQQEYDWACEIVKASGGHATLAPSTTLPELAEILRAACLFVGSDTGPMHLAAAVQTPCVAIFGPTRPEHCGPYGQQHITLQAHHQSGSRRQRKNADNQAMRAVPASDVSAACRQILARQSAVGPPRQSAVGPQEE